ncbi:MAG: hypothetical protein MK101_09275 [Phycisphaerales bacterium]|nr:hypothetical protein [Phycisphaerales bacterium]
MSIFERAFGAMAIAFAVTAGSAQTSGTNVRSQTIDVHSTTVANDTDVPAIVFNHLVAIPEAGDLQIRFGRTKLADGCTLRLTSLKDGHQQHLNATSLSQWQHHSAWFNGPMVHVELLAPAQSGRSHLTIEAARWTVAGTDVERSICGNTDDRIPSSDPRAARHWPVGCTMWLIDDAANSFLSAGHCMDEGVSGHVAQFNVPLSNGDGSVNHPGPEDQYPIDPESLQFGYVEIGNDWAYLGCFPNSETGLTAYQAQGASYMLADAPDQVSDQDITIIGYGTTSSPISPTWNQVQKTHTGPYAILDGTVLGYQTDTTGGNSGSAVLDEATGLAIGIHTNAGCSSTGGFNHGCAIHHADLQYALANPQGVCIPNVLQLTFPDGRPEILPPGTHTMDFVLEAGEEAPLPDSIEVGVSIDGSPMQWTAPASIGDDMWRHTWTELACEQTIAWQVRATGDEGTHVIWPLPASIDSWPLHVGEFVQTIILDTSFAGGIPVQWAADGLWHGSSGGCAPSDSCETSASAYFGQAGECDYDTGGAVTGTLTSPAVSLDGIGGDMVVRICMALETENSPNYDVSLLLVNGVTAHEFGDTSGWETIDVPLTSISGQSVQLGLQFDSGDYLYNDYTGWHVASVQIIAQETQCDSCVGDITGDGEVGANDILSLIAQWGQGDGPADLDGDGMVGASDLLIVLAGWGEC